MRAWIIALAALALWTAPGIAAAQEDGRGAALIAAFDAEDVFAPDQEHETYFTVRHRLSGLLCFFEADAHGLRLTVFPGSRGEDVSCNQMTADGQAVTTYFTRYDQPYSALFLAEDAYGLMQQRFPDGEPWAPSVEMLIGSSDAEPREEASFRLLIDWDGEPSLTRVTVTNIGGWSLKMRYTGALNDADPIETQDMIVSLRFWMPIVLHATALPPQQPPRELSLLSPGAPGRHRP